VWNGLRATARTRRRVTVEKGIAMFSLLPEEVIRSACQMACYGFAAFTAVIAFLFTPRQAERLAY
jgi:hypothetical protein